LNPKAIDIALKSFLDFLQCLRRVLLQDLAVIHSESPSCHIYSYHPFTTPLFQQFAAEALSHIAAAEPKTQQILWDIPERYSGVIAAMVRSNEASLEEMRNCLLQRMHQLKEQLIYARGEAGLTCGCLGKCQKISELLNLFI